MWPSQWRRQRRWRRRRWQRRRHGRRGRRRLFRRAVKAHQVRNLVSGVERRDAGWYFREADRLAAGARWSEAMRLAFQGVALRLEASGAIRYHPSKTPGELAREARLAGPDRARLRELVSGLYRHVFAGAPCDAEEWRRWRADAGGEWHAPAH